MQLYLSKMSTFHFKGLYVAIQVHTVYHLKVNIYTQVHGISLTVNF